MVIAVAGPYSSDSHEGRMENLRKLNDVAARLLERGHTPLIGINAALPVTSLAKVENVYEANMAISMAVISACDALLIIGESKGANRERDWMLANGRPVYTSIDAIPPSKK